MTEQTKDQISVIVLAIVGIGTLLNAGWMLISPYTWYEHLPAEVPDFGPYNVHFIRDLGCAFTVIGISLIAAARVAMYRLPFAAVGMLFYDIHALIHVYDTLRGHVDHGHWLTDLPLTYTPAIVLTMIVIRLYRRAPHKD